MWRNEKLKFYLSAVLTIIAFGILLIPRPRLAARMPDIIRQSRIFIIS
jgi:hypothetical protein